MIKILKIFNIFFRKTKIKQFHSIDEQNLYSLNMFNKAQILFNSLKFNKAKIAMAQYRRYINYNIFEKNMNSHNNDPKISVIIVAYNTNALLIQCLDSLNNQTNQNYEVIIVDNGKNDSVLSTLKSMSVNYIRCPQNLILSEGRNIGVYFAKGEIISFLDDDAYVNSNFIETIIEAFDKYNILGFRGRVLPKTNNKNNNSVNHYDLGEYVIPSIMNAEGNSSVKKNIYQEFNGMDPLLFGHEGFEFSYRVSKKYGYYSFIYWPKTIIFHDYAVTDIKLYKKNDRHKLMNSYINKNFKQAKKYKNKMKYYILNPNSNETVKIVESLYK